MADLILRGGRIIDPANGRDYRDVLGETRHSRLQLAARGLVIGGRWWYPPR